MVISHMIITRLQWGVVVTIPLFHIRDEDDRTPPTDQTFSDTAKSPELVRMYHVTIPGTFVEVSDLAHPGRGRVGWVGW